MKKLAIFLSLVFIHASGICQTYTKDNGVIHVELNGYGYPMITNFKILGATAVPHDNAGADFQMTARSAQGNAYNPTQGGDCRGNPSLLNGTLENWNGASIGVPAQNGILLGVQPRNYNDPSSGDQGCAGNGALLPYQFNFGVTIGDGVSLPKEAMVIDMSIQKLTGGQDIIQYASELPAIFANASFMRYAYYADTNGGILPYSVSVNGAYTNDITQWPALVNYSGVGKAVILCSIPNATNNSGQGVCMAIYSNFDAAFYLSHRFGSTNELSYFSMVGKSDPSATIADNSWHSLRRFILVGNISTIQGLVGEISPFATSNSNW